MFILQPSQQQKVLAFGEIKKFYITENELKNSNQTTRKLMIKEIKLKHKANAIFLLASSTCKCLEPKVKKSNHKRWEI